MINEIPEYINTVKSKDTASYDVLEKKHPSESLHYGSWMEKYGIVPNPKEWDF